jgi:hypothetical protein
MCLAAATDASVPEQPEQVSDVGLGVKSPRSLEHTRERLPNEVLGLFA